MSRHPLACMLSTAALGAHPRLVARAYADVGLAVIPLHCGDAMQNCSCGRDCGANAGKHPRTPQGHLDATTDLEQINAWWDRFPNANVGLATGLISGLVGLDIDPRHGGEATIALLEAEHGALPPTWAVETGGGGLHLYFRHLGGRVPNTAGRLGPGLDVRGDGGFLVAPPSRHRSGATYRWAAGWDPTRTAVADLPDWLARRLMTPLLKVGEVPSRSIPEGQRNATLACLAGAMRRRGSSEDAIVAALLADNARRCIPPLPDAEVVRIARSIARYPPVPASVISRPSQRPRLRIREAHHAGA